MTDRPFRANTTGKMPCKRDVMIDVQFRNGMVSKSATPAWHWRWSDTGHDFDVVAARRA